MAGTSSRPRLRPAVQVVTLSDAQFTAKMAKKLSYPAHSKPGDSLPSIDETSLTWRIPESIAEYEPVVRASFNSSHVQTASPSPSPALRDESKSDGLGKVADAPVEKAQSRAEEVLKREVFDIDDDSDEASPTPPPQPKLKAKITRKRNEPSAKLVQTRLKTVPKAPVDLCDLDRDEANVHAHTPPSRRAGHTKRSRSESPLLSSAAMSQTSKTRQSSLSPHPEEVVCSADKAPVSLTRSKGSTVSSSVQIISQPPRKSPSETPTKRAGKMSRKSPSVQDGSTGTEKNLLHFFSQE